MRIKKEKDKELRYIHVAHTIRMKSYTPFLRAFFHGVSVQELFGDRIHALRRDANYHYWIKHAYWIKYACEDLIFNN